MKLSTVTVLIALCLATGCSNGDDTPAAKPRTTPTTSTPTPGTPTPSTPTPTTEPVSDELKVGPIVPGAFTPVQVGQQVFEYMREGYLLADQDPPCDGTHWLWSDRVPDGLSVSASPTGTIGALGTGKDGLKTAEGIHVGSTYAALKQAYGSQLSAIQADDNRIGWVSVTRNGAWISFLLDKPGTVTNATKVAFIEVGRGKVLHSFGDAC